MCRQLGDGQKLAKKIGFRAAQTAASEQRGVACRAFPRARFYWGLLRLGGAELAPRPAFQVACLHGFVRAAAGVLVSASTATAPGGRGDVEPRARGPPAP